MKMLLDIIIWFMFAFGTRRITSLELQPGMPHVCADTEMSMLGARQPCVQAFTRTVKVWKQGCTGHHRWCVGYERRTSYYTTYRQVYRMDVQRVFRCCPGWRQTGTDRGCLHRVCAVSTCFNGGRCAESEDQLCQCPLGFQGTHCQHGKSTQNQRKTARGRDIPVDMGSAAFEILAGDLLRKWE
ncbi:hypothetical protein DPEC_G00241630 [Dallia pectoralis]|uniref:Uncharacterized protein n=1 Tax=Dallia pectoralis TaxID=75939 RepID=A0ACC2FUW6_DALPE|nr:hypothetical protein DPEC_G00241630 [Dallia pectoralis]